MGTLRTILRRLFYAAAAVSLLLLLATLLVWPVSRYRWMYARYVTTGEHEYSFSADSGRKEVTNESNWFDTCGWHFWAADPEPSHWSYLTWNTPDPDLPPFMRSRTFLGICWYHLPLHRTSITFVYIPFSYLAVLFCILPLLALRSILRRRRARRGERVGLCPRCGYDLRIQRAGAGGALCPECGTPVDGRGTGGGVRGES